MQFRLKVVVSGVAPKDQPDSGERTVRDIIKAVANKWQLKQRQIELRLCQSTAEIVQKDPRLLTKYDKRSSVNAKILDLLPKKQQISDSPCSLYLLYDIKKIQPNSSED